MARIDLLVVDDHPLLRAGVKVLLSSNSSIVITEASSGDDAIFVLKQQRVDIVLLDIDMPGKNGVDVARYIEENFPDIKTVFLTSHADFYTFASATDVAYAGFLFKENALELLSDCLATVARGDKYIGKCCVEYFTANKERLDCVRKIKMAIKLLTDTELRVLLLVSEGKTTPQIAEQLFNSAKTIENHRTNICQKLELKGSNNLLTFALENKWLFKND
ncbi:response regulator transcription factor [Williamwhitmania taraxaci]|uniref:Two component transcriptional regulator, LuxR family n=1 Tax=Williamwhitmania taraxaci TaxID=1640674 RepID=A0A1G6PB65_9BACT|nr:response regulator transcription factor [Williamwhitmania taraxaci]SDC77309.1 two component transcriptional regulator, LuxR family [Williamwhitmania taraxaci]